MKPRVLMLSIALLCCLGIMCALRLTALESDPYSRLSWSSGLLTDEGFYIHNARNLVLFGQERTDEFNNMLIMPTLHYVQVAVFQSFGYGIVQARMISVVCSLATVALLFDAARRLFGLRIAGFAALLLGLDHINLLYNRMALMDTPAAMLLTGGFWAFALSLSAGGRARAALLGACGALIGLAVITRGLCFFALPAPFVACRFIFPRNRKSRELDASPKLIRWMAPIGLGLAAVFAIYLATWYLPHRAELQHMGSYYLWAQLLPRDALRFLYNVSAAWLGDDRGAAPFLMRHSPVQTLLAFCWMITGAYMPGGANAMRAGMRRGGAAFVNAWMVGALVFLSISSYSPSRYYVLFYPALALVAAFALDRSIEILGMLVKRPLLAALPGGFAACHLAILIWHYGKVPNDILIALATIAGVIGAIVAAQKSIGSTWLRSEARHRIVPPVLLAWAAINTYYFADWLVNREYTQRDVGAWLTSHMAPNTVLIGDVAAGASLNSRLKAVTVIPGLCNDHSPVETFAGQPRAIVILDGDAKERWWLNNYPELVAPNNRIRFFEHVVRTQVGVYRVPRWWETSRLAKPKTR